MGIKCAVGVYTYNVFIYICVCVDKGIFMLYAWLLRLLCVWFFLMKHFSDIVSVVFHLVN